MAAQPYRSTCTIDGNKFDLSVTGLRSEAEQEQRDLARRDPAKV
jgi:hypothetical protein